jgi:hypothetical protein
MSVCVRTRHVRFRGSGYTARTVNPDFGVASRSATIAAEFFADGFVLASAFAAPSIAISRKEDAFFFV